MFKYFLSKYNHTTQVMILSTKMTLQKVRMSFLNVLTKQMMMCAEKTGGFNLVN